MKNGVKLKIRGFNELRRSPEVVQRLNEIADEVIINTTAFGGGKGTFAKRNWKGRKRAGVNVYAADPAAYRSNLKYNALLKGLNVTGTGEYTVKTKSSKKK